MPKKEAAQGNLDSTDELTVGRRPAALIGADVAAFVWRGVNTFLSHRSATLLLPFTHHIPLSYHSKWVTEKLTRKLSTPSDCSQ
jgi:hypothetical protein